MASADRLIEVFNEAKARPPGAERDRFLAGVCRDDPALKAQVRSLLQAHEGAGDFLKNSIPAPAVLPTEKPGDRIGRYKLLEQIGEGGCGVVYMAEQLEPVRRRVALKVIKLGMDTKQVIARFEAERQALALMDHPNIAKIFDAGVTGTPVAAGILPAVEPGFQPGGNSTGSPGRGEEPAAVAGSKASPGGKMPPSTAGGTPATTLSAGRPFFVMELVRGIKITDYCDQNNLPTEARLKLFTQVCHAIQHAHQKGIIHRDIKPSNILVTVNDGMPVPKVIDFGIAKATTGQLTDKTVFTAFAQFVGTPAYMSPEQAQMSGLDIDTRADIYSLGVLLYELLTGNTPFDAKELLAAGMDEMRRKIREDEPAKPSTCLSTMQAMDLTTVAKRRHVEPPRLIHLIRGDLDWLVMKCLEKDRTRRYATANALVMDLQRHLDDEPVVACPPSRAYRFQKFVRRNKLAFAAASAVTAALVIGLGVSTLMFFKEKQARQRAVAAEREQKGLRKQAEQTRQQVEARAYGSDMAFAAQSADSGGSLGSVEKVLSYWRVTAPGLRGWEWYYLSGLGHRDRLTIRGDGRGFYSAAWSPDGKRLASAGGDHTVRLWNALTGHEILKLQGHADVVVAVAWSPDGKQLASASKDKTVKVWDADTADERLTLPGHSDEVRCVAWSRDGKKLASGGADQPIRLWDAVTGRVIQTLPGRGYTQALSWNSDGTRLASADSSADISSSVTVWDTANGKELLTVGPGGILSVVWSPDDKRLAMGGYGSCGRILDAASGSNIVTMCHEGPVVSVAWSSDGTRVATGSRGDGGVKVWDAVTGQELQSFRGHLGAARSVSWHPDGTQVASASMDGTIRVWDANHHDQFRTTLRQPDQGISVAWHPDGRQLATGSSGGSVRIWDSTRAVESVVLPGHTSWVWKVVWNPTGTMLASGSHDGVIKLWDPKSGTEAWSVQGHPKEVRALAWSPDGKRLASVSGSDGHLKVWDAAAGKLSATFAKARGALALDWSPDGTHLATQSRNDILILDALSGKERWTLRGHTEGLRSVAWSPDGKRLASASDDTTIRIWDVEAGRQLHTLHGHVSLAYSVAWNPGGTRLVSGSWDTTVKIWNPATGAMVCSLDGHNAPVQSVGWSPDGTRIASSDIAGIFLIHDATPGHTAERKHKLAESQGRPGKAQGRKEASP